jgi:hypothetical protein
MHHYEYEAKWLLVIDGTVVVRGRATKQMT